MAILASFSVFSAFTQSDFFGKTIFISLFILSLLSWAVMINKIKTAKRTKRNSRYFEMNFEDEKANLLNLDLRHPFSKDSNPYFTIYATVKQKSLEILNKNKYFAPSLNEGEIFLSSSDVELVESQVSAIISNESKMLEKNLFVLSTVITLAPFMGLLGTVWGILVTFSGLQSDGLSSVNSAVLSGLSMALGTTVFGLVVAIPALVGYNYLKSFVADFSGDMELFSHNLMTRLEIQYRRVEKK